MPLERRERVVTNITVRGINLDQMVESACKDLDPFFGSRAKYEIIEFRAHPAAQELGGNILLWEAEVEAGEVWG